MRLLPLRFWLRHASQCISEAALSAPVAVLSVPVAAAAVELAGGPNAWVTRTYSASQGAGAQCNGKELKVTYTIHVTQTLLAKPTATALSVQGQ